jgi:hypothetical protein
MMAKRNCVLLAAVLLLAGCASSGDEDPNAPKITIHLEQLDNGGGNNFTFAGPVNLQYALTATNTTKDLVTLSRIEVRTISSGAYSISPTSTSLNIPISPGQSVSTTIAVWGYARGGRLSSEEPVTLRGTAYLSGPSGAFVNLFTEYISQR